MKAKKTTRSLGEHLKTLRFAVNLNATQAAAAVGVSETMIYKYESEAISPSYRTLLRLAEVYGVSLDTLMNPDA